MRNNGLSLALLALFLVCWLGQAVAGLNHYNDERSQHGHTMVRFSQYLRTSDFWEATFENWESVTAFGDGAELTVEGGGQSRRRARRPSDHPR